MTKYRVMVWVDDYLDVVVTAATKEGAEERVRVDFREGILPNIKPSVRVDEVDDDVPGGDVG